METYINRIFAELNIRDRTQAMILAYECGPVRPGDGAVSRPCGAGIGLPVQAFSTISTGTRWAQNRLDRVQQANRVLRIPAAVLRKFSDDRGSSQAALIAYYGFLSLFPLLLAALTIVGFILPRYPGAEDTLARSVLSQFPVVGPQLEQTVASNVHPIHGNLVALIVGVAGALWGGLGVTNATQTAIFDIWCIDRRHRPGLPKRVLTGLELLLVLALGVAATTTLALWAPSFGWTMAGTIVLFVPGVIVASAVAWLAFKVVSPPHIPTRAHLPGAVVAGFGWQFLQTVGVNLLTHQLRHSSQVYGTFAAILGLLGVLFLTAQLTVLAVEVNVVVARHLWPRRLFPPPPGTGPRRRGHVARSRSTSAR